MGIQFNRFCNVTVAPLVPAPPGGVVGLPGKQNGRLLKGLDVDFSITRSLDPTANTAELLVYNLSEDTRKYLSQSGATSCKIEAGYREDPFAASVSAALAGIIPDTESPQIFLGEMRTITSIREGADWVTRMSAGDGDTIKNTRVSFSMGPGTTIQGVMDKMAAKIKVGITDAAKALLKGQFKEVGKALTEGITIDGFAGDEMPRLLKSAGLEMSVQNGQIQILPIGGALGDVAIKLTPATGLVGSPEVGKDNRVSFRCLLTAKLYPGRKVKLESQNITGLYKCDSITYSGQTSGDDWYCDVDAAPITG